MAKYNKINWQKGMEITPQVLINADNFQIEQQNIIRRLQVMPCYGLLPESIFNADISTDGNMLSVSNLVIQAVTPQGEIIDINEQGKEPHRLDLNQYTRGSQFYVALNYNDPVCPEKDTFFVTGEANQKTSAVVIAKISDNIVSLNYIPPCVFINSHHKLLEIFEGIRQKTENIITQIKNQDRYKSTFLPLSLLEFDLKNYSAFETPSDLFSIVKKFVSIFKLNITEIPEKTGILLNETYCHTEIYDRICLLLDSLCEIEEITKAPVEGPKIQKIQIAVK